MRLKNQECLTNGLMNRADWLNNFWMLIRVIQKVHSLSRGGGGSHWKVNKKEQGEGGPSMCLRSLFENKMLRFSKWSFIVISYWLQWQYEMLNKPSWKINANEWRAIAFAGPHYGTYPLVIYNLYFVVSSYKCTNVVNLVWRLQNEKDFAFWGQCVVVTTTAQLHSTKPELGFCTG